MWPQQKVLFVLKRWLGLWLAEAGQTGEAVETQRPDHYSLVLDTSEMAGTISVDLTDGNPGGTIVDVTVELQSKGLLSSLFFPVVSRAIGDGLSDQIEEMAERLASSPPH